nr:histone deacetylase 14 [Tanacetum cinerariifolium]
MCQLDEQWFVLTKDTLREALQKTPVNSNQAFIPPPTADALINFVNELGYPKLVRKFSNVILWGIVTRANIDYAERIWEEFNQSIHTFIEDKRNLSRHTTGKKKATLIVIPSIQFTKLIIHHLQRRHKFHPRLDSPLHLPNEEPVLGYLKFSAKGTKREVFGMPIPGSLITTDIQEASYYQEHLAKVAKHRRYLAGEIGSDPDSPALKPTKPARKPNVVPKVRKPRSTLKSVAESVAEDAPAKEPHVEAEDADLHRALEESMKSMFVAPRGPLPPVVIREPKSGKYQPLPEPKKKIHADQYIFQRRTFTTTGSFGHDELSYAELGQSKSEETEKVMPGADEGGQGKGEGQVGPDPGTQAECQTGSDAGPVLHAGSDREHMDLDAADVSPQPSSEQLDEGFTTMAYLKIQENLKLTVEEQVLLEDSASSSGTLLSLQHLSKDISFGDLLFSDKPSEADNDKETAKTEVESMVSVMIQQDMSSIPPMTSPIIDPTSRPESPKKKKKSRESPKTPPGSPPHQPPPLPPPAGPSGASGAPGASGSSQVPPPPPPSSSTNQESQSKGSAAPSSSKTAASAKYQAWMMTDIRLRPSISLTLADLEMDEDMGPDEQAQTSDDEDIRSAHIPKLLTDSMDDPILRHNVSKPLPLGGPPGQVTIQSDCFFNKDLEYPRYGSKGSRPAMSITKMKAAYYLDVGLKQMVPDQFWIEEECKYDIVAIYGISHWWLQRKRFYIDRHTSEGDRSAVRTHMRILSVVKIEIFYMYGYDYMKKIVLRHLNHLPPKDKKILTTAVNQWTKHLVIRQYVEDFQLGIESYQTQLNLTKPQWDAMGFEYKHDYTVIDSPRAVMFRDRYGVQMMMRFNEIHKFCDGTLQQIDEALDYRVKEFRINRMNPGLNTRFWTRKDVDRSKAFMFAIQKRLKTRRIFRNLESFVDGRVREGDYRLLKLCSSLRSLKPKRTIESRAKRSSKIISLGHYSIMLASSHAVKMKMEILLEPTSSKLLVANELTDAFGKPFKLLAKEMSIHNSMLTLHTYIKDKMTAERPTTQLLQL